MQKLFVGLTTSARPGWESYFAEPKTDGRLTDPAKIQADREKKLMERAADAPLQPVAATIMSAAILGEAGDVMFSVGEQGPTPDMAYGFCDRLAFAMRGQLTWVYGFNAPQLLQLAWLDSACQARNVATALRACPAPTWRHAESEPPTVIDPYASALRTVELRNQISPGSLASFLRVDYPPNLWSSALLQAVFARNLSLALGL